MWVKVSMKVWRSLLSSIRIVTVRITPSFQDWPFHIYQIVNPFIASVKYLTDTVCSHSNKFMFTLVPLSYCLH